jgi:hypothetical protein
MTNVQRQSRDLWLKAYICPHKLSTMPGSALNALTVRVKFRIGHMEVRRDASLEGNV